MIVARNSAGIGLGDLLVKRILLAAAFTVGSTVAQAATVTTSDTTTILSSEPSPGGLYTIAFREILVLTEGITQVAVSGFGLFTYPDIESAPGPDETGTAIADAFLELGVSTGATVSSSQLTQLDPVSSMETFLNITQTPDSVWIGDPAQVDANCAMLGEGLVIITGEIRCTRGERTETDQPYRLDVTLSDEEPGVVPLPPSAMLLIGGFGGLVLARRTRRRRRPFTTRRLEKLRFQQPQNPKCTTIALLPKAR